MRRFRAILLPASVLLATLLLGGCVRQEAGGKYIVGFSQCTDDMWRQIMTIQMEAEAAKYPDIQLRISQAHNDTELQINQIRDFVNAGVDLLIISPNESSPITPIAVEAYERGIPTIIWDRKIDSSSYTSYISADNYSIGRDVGRYVRRVLPDGGTVLEILGLEGSSPAKERHDGFMAEVGTDYRIRYVYGDWKPDVAGARVKDLRDYSGIDLIFGHNDDMAISAWEAVASVSREDASRIRFVGIDAIVGVDAVIDGRLDASFLYPPGGEFVMETTSRILHGENVEKDYTLKSSMVDLSNAATLKAQSEQILNYQNFINSQRKELDDIQSGYRFFRLLLIVLAALAVLLISLVLYSMSKVRRSRKLNSELKARNDLISARTEELVARNNSIELQSNQKLQFFTNLSHEVRTPLTLILNPLERMARKEKDPELRDEIWTLQHNARHLLKIVNQILDFRKVENNKMQLFLRETDLVGFAAEIVKYFESYAQNEKILYKFQSGLPELKVWIDTDKVEQILVNLISNAFKNSRKYGVISVNVDVSSDRAVVEVHDTGKGMDENTQQRIFDRFYSVGDTPGHGVGIGLHLSKEYALMHKGDLSVRSEPGKFSSFFLELPLGKEWIPSDAALLEGPEPAPDFPGNDEKVRSQLSARYDARILVVEDDEQIRSYLVRELSENFEVVSAPDGFEALGVLKDEDISIVLSDVLMPRINGFQLCRDIKSDMATSHIPVVLLTALNDDNQRIYGISEGADEYIQKPFNMDFLKVKLIRILEERRSLKEEFARQFGTRDNLSSEMGGIPCADDSFRDRINCCLEAGYADHSTGIEELSTALCVSRVQLFRKTKAIFGLSPTELLSRYRLGKAANYLKLHKYTVSEVSDMVGFSSAAYFTKCFRDYYGMSPTKYSKQE